MLGAAPTFRHRLIATVFVFGLWAMSVGLGGLLEPPPWVRLPALLVHIAALVVGLGAAVMIEYHAVLWMTGGRPLHRLLVADRIMATPVWLGAFGLLASGALLQPMLGTPLTWVKLCAVLGVLANGVWLTHWTSTLHRLPPTTRFGEVELPLRVALIVSGALSQLLWWTAVAVGLMRTSGAPIPF